MNIRKPLFIILALVLLCCGGCSKVTIGYNYADWLLRYRITDYTSFNAAQKEEIRVEVENYMHWHRKNALPQYTAFLQDLNGVIMRDGAYTASDVIRLRAENNKLYQLTMLPMVAPAARILGTLDSRQIAGLGNTFANKNRKQKEERLPGSEQEVLVMRAERHIAFVENLVGDLSDAQAEKITAMSLRIPFATRFFIEQRETKQASLIALLNSHAGEAQIAALLRQWIAEPEISRSPQQQQAIAAYENAMNEMTAQIFNLLTTSQKQHLSEKIVPYINDFEKLNAAIDPVSI